MVSEIAQKRAGVAIADHPAGFIERIEGLVDKVKSGARTVVIKLNPDDLKAVQDWQQETSFPATWIFKEDSALGHGDIKMRLDGIFVTDQLCDTDQQSHVQMQVNIDDVADQLPSLDQRQAAAGAELETDELSQTGQEPEMNMPETAPDSSFEAGLEADAPSPFEIGLEGGSQEAAETGSQSPFAIGLEAVSAHLSDDETGSSETEFTSQGNLENALAFWETDNQDATPSISDFAADQPDEVFSNIADNLAENTEIDQTHQEGLADDPFAQGLESEESEHSDSLSSDEQPPEEPV